VLDRLSVFAGGWTLDAAESVASGGDVADWQVLDLLAALVAKSLVQAEMTHGPTRYQLLETVRHYAAERLTQRARSDLQDARVAHRDHYLSLVETADARLRGPEEAAWLDRLEAEFDNIRAALAFSIADPGSAESGLRLATGLRWFCYMRGHSGEIIEALGALLGRPDARQPTRDRARALTANCHLLNNFGRSPATPSMAEEAITIARSLADDSIAADALCALCWHNFLAGDLPAALARADEAVALARSAGNPHLLTTALGHRAAFKGEAGDLDAAATDQQEARALALVAGDNYALVLSLLNLGCDQVAAGEIRAGIAYLQEGLGVAEAHGYQHPAAAIAVTLGFAHLKDEDAASARRPLIGVLDAARATGEKTFAHIAVLGLALAVGPGGDPTIATTLHGAADCQYERAGQGFDPLDLRLRTIAHARLRDALGEAAFDAAYQHGRTLSQADAIALALSTAQHDAASPAVGAPAVRRASADSPAGPLSVRERQIIALLAGGASNATIAKTLFVTPNTVRTHLDRIRDKTGARNRAELTRYAMQAGIEPVVPSP
jgi:DNA-binding CsgD family transcriptional regulator